jgi:hypothetical protein
LVCVTLIATSAFKYLGQRTRLPLKRAHDEHVEKMTMLLERLALAVERLDEKLNGVAKGVDLLRERT